MNTDNQSDTGVSCDVYIDLGFSRSQAKRLQVIADGEPQAVRQLKVVAASAIADWMKAHSLNHTQAAFVLKVSRPRISDVINLKVDKFTLDSLLNLLERAGTRVQLNFKVLD